MKKIVYHFDFSEGFLMDVLNALNYARSFYGDSKRCSSNILLCHKVLMVLEKVREDGMCDVRFHSFVD